MKPIKTGNARKDGCRRSIIIGTLLCLFTGLLVSRSVALPLQVNSLDNGLTVIIHEDHRAPAVAVRLVNRTGATRDPVGMSGTANLAARLMLDGTTARTAESIATIIEFHGMRRSAGAGLDFSWLQLQALSEHLDTVLTLITESARLASYPDDEFERERNVMLSSVRRGLDSPGTTAMTEFNRLLFENHPYHRSAWGDTFDLPRIAVADVRQFHAEHWRPDNCFLIVVGAVEHQDLMTRVERLFGDWSATGPRTPPPEVRSPEFPPGIRVRLITRPDLNQSYVAMGHPGLAVTDPDMHSARLMSYTLGGSALGSRLGESIRTEAGLAYDVGCWYDRNAFAGAFRTTVQTINPAEAISRIRKEFELMHTSGPSEQETQSARNYFTGNYPLRYSSTAGKLAEITFAEIYEFGPSWFDEFFERVNSVTRDDMAAAATNHLRPDDLLVVIVSPLTRDELDIANAVWLE